MSRMTFLVRRDNDSNPGSMAGMAMDPSPSSPSSSFGAGMSTAFYASTSTSPSLWLSAFTPPSPGAVAAACLALAVLACMYRLLNALERLLVRGWAEQAVKRDQLREERRSERGGRSTLAQGSDEDARLGQENRQGQGVKRRSKCGGPGWWTGIDVPRGLYQVLLSGVGYLLMLAVMTFNVYYFISILLGLGLGECLFGRYGRSPPPMRGSRASSSSPGGTAGTSPSSSSSTSSSGGFRSFSGEGSPLELDGTRLKELNRRGGQGKRHELGQASVGEEAKYHNPLHRPLLLRGDGALSSTSSGSSIKLEGTEGEEEREEREQEQAYQMGIGVAR